MPQFRFAFENDSEAAGKTATSLAPAATAASKPWMRGVQITMSIHEFFKFYILPHNITLTLMLGVKTGNLAPSTF